MPLNFTRRQYAEMFGPTVGDRVRLADTDLFVEVERDLVAWMEEHEYTSVSQLKGSLSQKNCPDPAAFERAQYMKALCQFPIAQ